MLTQTISGLTMMKPDWCLLEDINVITVACNEISVSEELRLDVAL